MKYKFTINIYIHCFRLPNCILTEFPTLFAKPMLVFLSCPESVSGFLYVIDVSNKIKIFDGGKIKHLNSSLFNLFT